MPRSLRQNPPQVRPAEWNKFAKLGRESGLLAVLVLLLVARVWVSDEPSGWGHGLLIVLMWGLLAAWMCGQQIAGGQSKRWGTLEWAGLVWLGWMVAAAWWGPDGELRERVNTVWAWLGFGCAFVVLRASLSGGQVRTVVAVMLGLAGALGSYGIYQRVVELPAKRDAFLAQAARYQADPQAMLRETGLSVPPENWDTFLNRLRSPEPYATFALANSLAGFLVPWCVMLFGVAIYPTGQARAAMCWLLWSVWLAMIGGCLWLTHSRTGCLAATAGVAMLLAVRWIKWNKTTGVAVACGGGLLLGSMWMASQSPVFASAKQSFSYRVEYWQSSLMLLADHRWFGCGPGNFKEAYLAYKLPHASEEVSDPHNAMLEVAATAGAPAAVALLLLLGCWLYQTVPHWTCWRLPNALEKRDNEVGDLSMMLPSLMSLAAWLGVGLGCLMGLQADLPVNPVAWLLGLVVVPMALVWLRPWISGGTLPVVVPSAAALASLLNLQAAGGFSFPAVAESFWLLLAVSLCLIDPVDVKISSINQPRRWGSACGLAGAALGVVTCYFTAYYPVVMRQAHLLAAQRTTHEEQLPWLLKAAAADPWAEKPALELARWHWWQWWYFQHAEDWNGFEQWQRETLARSPQSAPVWFALGRWFALADRRQTNEAWAKQAADYFQQAVRLYPTNATYRGEWAVVMSRLGISEADEQARLAWKLNEELPHRDKKISAELQAALQRIIEGP